MTGPIFFAVPIGTPAAICRAASCRKPIYFIKTPKGNQMPIDCDVPGGKPPTRMLPGQGVPHFGTCVAVAEFKRAKA